jgi:hypothetical protein
MSSCDSLLAEYQIESPSDRALVRVVAAAVAEPTDKKTLLAYSGLANKNDLAMAGALIDTVRARPADGSGLAASRGQRSLLVALSLALLAVAVLLFAYIRVRAEAVEQGSSLTALTTAHHSELAAVRSELADLVKKSAAGLTGAGLSAEAFRAATADYLEKKDALNREILRLNAELTALKEVRGNPKSSD